MKFNPKNPKQGKYLDLTNELYHSSKGIGNSSLQMIANNPADYIWSQNAPCDPVKTGAFDVGTAIHAALLEPHKAEAFEVFTDTKSRDTVKFTKFVQDNPDKMVLTENEYYFMRLSVDSAHAHPTVSRLLKMKGERESSIFWHDKERDIMCKIRPDLDLTIGGMNRLVDVKKTASIDDWRSDVQWKNPLFKFNYGHNAAYYLHVASNFYGIEYNEYTFVLIQSTISDGKYPVGVFTITREELTRYGFFDQVYNNLDLYAECLHSNKWDSEEQFPLFRIYDDNDSDVEITLLEE